MRADLLRSIADAEPSALPALLGMIEEARGACWARLTAEAAKAPELKFLSVDEAADLARLPRRRVFSLARSAPWAARVGRRLLIEEGAFRRWLDAR